MSVPFHKQTDPNKQAGQIVNPIPEQYLHQYIAKKDDSPPRITFDEFLLSCSQYDDGTYPFGYDPTRPRDFMCLGTLPVYLEKVWIAALTKGKL